ncbi:polymorphic toxin-type HINT domain-containing protein [Aquimarina longa]|uniref:polymorphic toxin-type HINT domain-containing protein n=1 Tax=Aquimarina longa TaxID=1080221 RepID=UPI0007814C63|nr:polymorphic toxin-type HINT domain-containing protein [Aquimarina longa]
MPHDLEYIVKDALMMCDKGALPGPFTPTSNTHIKINSCLVTTKADKAPMTNIPSFGACAVKNGNPCTPAPIDWTDTYKVKVKGQETILFKSKMPCSTGGKIEFITSGQVPIPPEEYDKLMEEHGEDDDSGWGWWDTAELIPVVGNIIGMVREGAKGNWGMVALNAGFLVLDIVTLGTASIGTAAAKGAIKGGIKVAAKKTAQKALQGAVKLGTKQGLKQVGKGFAKAAAKKVNKLKGLKECVTACFIEGTYVTTKTGKVKIEQIAVGDEVLAFNSEKGKNEYQKVTNTVVNKVDYILKLKFHNEEITTTDIHPFYVDGNWILAEKLQIGTMVTTAKGRLKKILSIERIEQINTIVYNLEVNDLHNFYVGEDGVLVHNGPCDDLIKWTIGRYDDLHKLAKSTGLDSHHLVQSKKMKVLLERLGKVFDHEGGISILVPFRGHRHKKLLSDEKVISRWNGKKINKYIDDVLEEGKEIYQIGRDLLAKDIKEMRRVYKDVPNEKLQELIKLNKEKFPELFKNPKNI